MNTITSDSQSITVIQSLKGAFYVIATAFLLYFLIRRNESSLRGSEHHLKTLLESLPEAVIVINRQGLIVETNRAACELFSLSREEILVQKTDLLRKIDLAPTGLLVKTLAGETTHDREAAIQTSAGGRIPVSISASPARENDEGRVTRAIVVFRNVSELKRLERLRDEFLSTAAHELKTPMTTIKAYVTLLKKWRPDDLGERESKALTVLGYQTDRMNKLIQELLEFSRLQLGRLQLDRTRFDLRELVAEVISHAQGISPAHRLELHNGHEHWVMADRDRVEQVLVNLIDNAIKFSPEGGPIEVSIGEEEGRTQVAIQDRGLGISEPSQRHLFDRYYRAHSETSYNFSAGMGMGLYISRELINRHGGTIWCESREGQGSTFHFTLPSAQPTSNEEDLDDGEL
ncbi:MAG: ATP-binding protein [Oligoflexia bacterium]|nr:ATP-binding protein [Oligoflexia bacterium]